MTKPIICCRGGCNRNGQWVPIIVVAPIAQDMFEKPIKTVVSIALCDKHKNDFNPRDALTADGWRNLKNQVLSNQHRVLDMDKVTVEWKSVEQLRNTQQ